MLLQLIFGLSGEYLENYIRKNPYLWETEKLVNYLKYFKI